MHTWNRFDHPPTTGVYKVLMRFESGYAEHYSRWNGTTWLRTHDSATAADRETEMSTDIYTDGRFYGWKPIPFEGGGEPRRSLTVRQVTLTPEQRKLLSVSGDVVIPGKGEDAWTSNPRSPRPKKGSFEDVFGHLGTPEQVADEWTRTRDALAFAQKEVMRLLTRATELSTSEETNKQMMKAQRDEIVRLRAKLYEAGETVRSMRALPSRVNVRVMDGDRLLYEEEHRLSDGDNLTINLKPPERRDP
jgi:hypothetical protein